MAVTSGPNLVPVAVPQGGGSRGAGGVAMLVALVAVIGLSVISLGVLGIAGNVCRRVIRREETPHDHGAATWGCANTTGVAYGPLRTHSEQW